MKRSMASRHHEEIEQEVKIKLSRGDLEKVFRSVSRRYAPKEVTHKYMPRHYYDTATLQLHKNAISLRIQYKSGRGKAVGGYEQTVKFELPHGNKVAKGALFRKECKNMLDEHEPDLHEISDRQARAIMKSFRNRRMRHLFTAAIERRYFEVEVGHGRKKATIEVAFDVGEIILSSNGRHYPFYEIELEKKRGNARGLDKLRERILKTAKSARLQPLSKSQQGCELHLKVSGRKRRQP